MPSQLRLFLVRIQGTDCVAGFWLAGSCSNRAAPNVNTKLFLFLNKRSPPALLSRSFDDLEEYFLFRRSENRAPLLHWARFDSVSISELFLVPILVDRSSVGDTTRTNERTRLSSRRLLRRSLFTVHRILPASTQNSQA
ncbi:hypothetical protein N657DRAFT_292382 [Parathielavia appendiculata]|uniref:Uncharacterized protein n=1 Tax=Parathielavia appendiculata TaxID=2587402 RepID=A0AAN6U494_9PEZI|nr:hypothetical protein N657DRAFT_292382 [Parathielavia appendiculata]